jgi:cyclophilin family peptidyl-prolyl cis-trans isomerase
MKADEPAYDGQYASFGTISSGLSVIDAVILGDTITSITITE